MTEIPFILWKETGLWVQHRHLFTSPPSFGFIRYNTQLILIHHFIPGGHCILCWWHLVHVHRRTSACTVSRNSETTPISESSGSMKYLWMTWRGRKYSIEYSLTLHVIHTMVLERLPDICDIWEHHRLAQDHLPGVQLCVPTSFGQSDGEPRIVNQMGWCDPPNVSWSSRPTLTLLDTTHCHRHGPSVGRWTRPT